MRWYEWLRPHFEQLITGYQTGRVHHALLVHALPGMGVCSLIYAIVRFLMCQDPQGYKSCGKCHSCYLMKAGTHPDYHNLEFKEGKNILGVEAVRQLSEKLHEHARLGGVKVVWLNDVALLTESATNALLKLLEEPPEKTWFFFFCYEVKHLLMTLLSRCRLYRLTVPREQWALNWLQRELRSTNAARKVPSDDLTVLSALRLCCGAPAAALRLLQENHWTQRAKLCSALHDTIKSQDWLSLLSTLNNEQASIHLQWLISLLLDALKFQQGATNITNVDAHSLINNLACVLNSATLHAIIYLLCQCRKQLLTITGINRELMLIDRLLLIEHCLQPDTSLPVPHL